MLLKSLVYVQELFGKDDVLNIFKYYWSYLSPN